MFESKLTIFFYFFRQTKLTPDWQIFQSEEYVGPRLGFIGSSAPFEFDSSP
jgi:hypothetical protein